MNFIIGLPKIRYRHDSIFMVVDRLTKLLHFILINTIYNAHIIAKKFMKEIFRLHRFLESIFSNRENKFKSNVW